VFPVCSPAFAQRGLSAASQFSTSTLLNDDSEWRFLVLMQSGRSGCMANAKLLNFSWHQFTELILLCQAANCGQGVALGKNAFGDG